MREREGWWCFLVYMFVNIWLIAANLKIFLEEMEGGIIIIMRQQHEEETKVSS